jgi:hypothetical protein
MLVSYDRMVEWSAAAGHLAEDGGTRATKFLQRVTARERRPAREPAGGDFVSAEKPFRFAAVTFGVALVMTTTGERAGFGLNLFTAELVIAAVALILFFTSLRRCV